MRLSTIRRSIRASAAAAALALILSSCTATDGQTSAQVTTEQAFSNLTESQDTYISMLNSADSNSRFPLIVLSARSSIVEGDFAAARELISLMRKEAVTPLQKDQADLIESQLCMYQKRIADARFALSRINIAQLPVPVAAFYYQLSAGIELSQYAESRQIDHLIRACKEKITLLSLVNADAQKQLSKQIVNHLKSISPAELTVLASQQSDPVFRGFIEYALIDTSGSAALKEQMIETWMKSHKDHPLYNSASVSLSKEQQSTVPEGTASYTAVSLKEGDNLAVLLPLSGRFAANVGEPARLGILAALQDRNAKLKVTFYDTNRMTMESIVSALKQSGTNYIIGPILKPEVDALLSTDMQIPAIVFNQPSSAHDNLYYYDLGPDYEGALAARKMNADRIGRAVVIVPSSARGSRAAAGFEKEWQKAGHREPSICSFTGVNTVTADLSTCPISGADGIYMHGTAAEVIKARPLMSDNTPLYLTDRSFQGINAGSFESAAAGAILGDMPWLLTESALKQDLLSSLPEADSQVQRIFAVAYDSIALSFNMERLYNDPSDILHGLSGEIKPGEKGLIETAPMWITLSIDRPLSPQVYKREAAENH